MALPLFQGGSKHISFLWKEQKSHIAQDILEEDEEPVTIKQSVSNIS